MSKVPIISGYAMILQHIDVNDTGLQLEDWPLSPFLNTGATIAVFQSDGILLWLMDAWNINVSAGVISLAVSFFSYTIFST